MAGASPAAASPDQLSVPAAVGPPSRYFPYVIAGAAVLLAVTSAGSDRLTGPVGTLDVDQFWHAGRALLAGDDPYAVIGPDGPARFPWRFYYPLSAAVLLAPLGLLPLHLARIAFIGVVAAIFGYALGRTRSWAWPALLSIPFLTSAVTTQLSPLLAAGMLVPALGWLVAVKPNIGLVVLAQSHSRRQVALALGGGTALVLLSLAFDPAWPAQWLRTVSGAEHFRPLLFRPGGFLGLLALLRWRDPDARLLAALAVVPQTGMWYEALPVFLTVRSRAQALVLMLTSHAAFIYSGRYAESTDFADQTWPVGTLVVWSLLLPAVAFVLLRAKERAIS